MDKTIQKKSGGHVFSEEYFKFKKGLRKAFQESRISFEARNLFLLLAEEINIDGNKTQISNKLIESELDISARKRRNLITELSKDFVDILPSNGSENVYYLKLGVFKGTTEKPFTRNKTTIIYNNKRLSYPKNTPTTAVPTSVQGGLTTPKTIAVRVQSYTCNSTNSFKHVNKQIKQQHVDVLLLEKEKNELAFSGNSPFRLLSAQKLSTFREDFGFERLQKAIIWLELAGYDSPEKIDRNAAGLLHTALKKFDIWEWESKKIEEAKKKEVDWNNKKKFEQQELARNKLDELEEAQRDEDYKYAIRDKELLVKTKMEIKDENPSTEEDDELFKALFNERLIIKYRQKLNSHR